MWVVRTSRPGHILVRTAYWKRVATRSPFQAGVYGTAILRRLAVEIADYDLGRFAVRPSDSRRLAGAVAGTLSISRRAGPTPRLTNQS